MNRLALLLAALTLAATGCRSADTAGAEARPSLLERMTPSMKLPQELSENAVVIPVANVRTSRNPLAFSPYRVTAMKRGWRRISDPSFGQIWIGEKREQEPFSFILQREGEDLWSADCRWASSSMAGGWSDEDEELEMESRREQIAILRIEIIREDHPSGATDVDRGKGTLGISEEVTGRIV